MDSNTPTTTNAEESRANSPGGQRTNSNNRRINNSRTNFSSPITFEGECDKIGVVIGLRIERFHKKSGYQFFVEKVGNYIVKKLTDGADIKMLLTEGRDPIKTFEENNLPESLGAEDQDDPIKDAILKEEIKQYVSRNNNIRRNVQTAFGLIWGQCSNALQAYVKGVDGYTTACKDYDVKWLLSEIKKASSGVNSIANPYLTYHEGISGMYKMRQGGSESDDNFVERFKDMVTTVEMVHGENVFYSHGITGVPFKDATAEEKLAAKEANQAVLLLMNSDPVRYGGLSSNLKDSADLGRDEYPKTLSGMYELMVKFNRHNSRNGQRVGTRRGSLFAQARSEGKDENEPIAG